MRRQKPEDGVQAAKLSEFLAQSPRLLSGHQGIASTEEEQLMSKTIAAAFIVGTLGIASAIIAAAINHSKTISVATSGDDSQNIVVGEMKNSNIVVNQNPGEGLTKEVRTITNQVIEKMDAVPTKVPQGMSESTLLPQLNEALAQNPYNVRALLVRGQRYYTNAISFGGPGMRQGLADFGKAASVDRTLADPHFGVGTILYNLGFFDIAQRGLYKIIEKGQFRQDHNTHQLEMRPPDLELFPDKRNYAIFQAALDEFEKGQKLAQLHEQSKGMTVVFFEPQDVANRIRSIRQFIGHQPQVNQDDELLKAFSSALSKVKPNEAFGGLFDVEANTEK